MRLAVGPGAVARLIGVARRFAETCGLAPEAADRLVIVVEEWAANIVEHSAARPGSLIVFRLEAQGGVVHAVFTDAGMAFDPRTAAQGDPNPERGGGAGIPLIRAWSEIEDWRRRGGRNRLTLRLRS